jgi:Na+/H+-translocating membrane pyrophosphatase
LAGLLGSMLVFLFSAWTIRAVGSAAQLVVAEVKRQWQQNPDILLGRAKPDYRRCVALVTRAALRRMVWPGLLAVLFPVAVGVSFRALGSLRSDALLGARAVAALLLSATTTGVLMSLYLNNAGGAWDNAKKLIESDATGRYGGKGGEAHKASVTGDTVGDPFKDAAGPSIHVLIKLLSTVTLVACPLFVPSPA